MTTLDLQAHDVRRLFDKDNLNLQDDRGYTCLHWLVVTGNSRLLRSLLEHYQDSSVFKPELRDVMSLTALDRACQLGRLHMVQTLVHAFPDSVHDSRSFDGRTPLHFANESVQPSVMVSCLVELGADVNAASRLGRTIWHESILRGYSTEHIQYLIAYGANLHARDINGWTPLHYAAYMGHADIVEQLLLYGANPGATDSQGRTPLHVTASKVVLRDWDQSIVTPRDDLPGNNVCSPKLKQTQEWARNFGRRTSSDIVRMLLQHGARTWEIDTAQNLTFAVAAQAGEVEVSYEMIRVAAMEGLFG
jgi:ankyrin repeat protein